MTDPRDELRRLGIPPDLIDTATMNGKPIAEVKPRKSKVDRMNKTEALYSFELGMLKQEGTVSRWLYESIKFRLADRTWYTPDFDVWLPDGRVRIVEIKGGFVRDDAAVKFKMARELYPEWEWLCLQKVGPNWRELFT